MSLLLMALSKFSPNPIKIRVPYRLPMESWLRIGTSTIVIFCKSTSTMVVVVNLDLVWQLHFKCYDHDIHLRYTTLIRLFSLLWRLQWLPKLSQLAKQQILGSQLNGTISTFLVCTILILNILQISQAVVVDANFWYTYLASLIT
jgi:hypothetical protein